MSTRWLAKGKAVLVKKGVAVCSVGRGVWALIYKRKKRLCLGCRFGGFALPVLKRGRVGFAFSEVFGKASKGQKVGGLFSELARQWSVFGGSIYICL